MEFENDDHINYKKNIRILEKLNRHLIKSFNLRIIIEKVQVSISSIILRAVFTARSINAVLYVCMYKDHTK